MNFQEIFQIVIPGLSGVLGAFGATFWLRRWVDKTDKRLDNIQDNIAKINVNLAIGQERYLKNEHSCQNLDKKIMEVEKIAFKALHFVQKGSK